MPNRHALRLHETCFWVIHRGREYGPFDYEWSADMRGIELTYRGSKFGEICSEAEIFADLREFSLPMRVVQVASITLGCIVSGIGHGLSAEQRRALIEQRLIEFGCDQFVTENE
jgi:hypothetical protein